MVAYECVVCRRDGLKAVELLFETPAVSLYLGELRGRPCAFVTDVEMWSWLDDGLAPEGVGPNDAVALVFENAEDRDAYGRTEGWDRRVDGYLHEEMWKVYQASAPTPVTRETFEIAYYDALDAIREMPCEQCGTIDWPIITKPEPNSPEWRDDPSPSFSCRRCHVFLADPFVPGAIRPPTANYPFEGVLARPGQQAGQTRIRRDIQATKTPAQDLPVSHSGVPVATGPRGHRNPEFVVEKRRHVMAAQVRTLNELVERLRRAHPDALIPWFDPAEAGTAAPILLLPEAPGRRAAPEQGSGFVSADNNDQTAENLWSLLAEAKIDRQQSIVTLNVVPWYIGDTTKIRPAHGADIQAARAALSQLLELLPNLKVVLLLGRAAQKAWTTHRPTNLPVPVLSCPHPSPKNLNTRPEARRQILDSLQRAADLASA